MIAVRFEQPEDSGGVRQTNELAFDSPLEARLVDALRGSAGSISLVATMDERVVGHILFTPVSIEPPISIRVAGLGPMAVRPEHQRSGIGSQLVRAGLDECARYGYSAVVVLGHPDYYPRFGFAPAHTLGLTCEFPSPPEAFMAIEIEVGALSAVVGATHASPSRLVRYSPVFSDVS